MGAEPEGAAGEALPTSKTVGLLFVHGIGQQQPFEHLTSSVSEIAELLKRDGQTSCAVVDRTPGLKFDASNPTALGEAPVTLTVSRAGHVTRFECHEVYWADLGARDGIVDTIRFWFWGLGQWAAPVYRELDAAQLDKSDVAADGKTRLNRQASTMARLPRSVAGFPLEELNARWQLALAGLAALLTLISWSLVKRIFAAALKTAPGPSILAQYVGDVRTYEESARPGDTALSDPGFPRRVGIRRRMVTQMVAMGDRAVKGDYDRWYVLGHSLGSVLTYNGLTEIGHTLPNYLGEAQWNALDPSLRTDPDCARRSPDEVPFMMPARPAWLAHDDVINRRALFEKLSGILTYGSPLNKFAALWPRIVATATDRADHATVFPQHETFRWLNMRAPLDPVAGDLDRYGARDMGPSEPLEGDSPFETLPSAPRMKPQFAGYVPSPETYTTPFRQLFLQAHLEYFRNQAVFARGYPIEHRMQLAQWLLDPAQTIRAIKPLGGLRKLGMLGVALGIVLLLLVLTALIVTIAGGVGTRMFTASKPDWTNFGAVFGTIGPVLVIALGIVLFAGLLRWRQDSRFNLQTAAALAGKARKAANLRQTNQIATENDQQLRLHRRQFIAANAMLLLYLPILASAWLWFRVGPDLLAGYAASWLLRLPCVSGYIVLLGVLAMTVQAVVNTTVEPLRAK